MKRFTTVLAATALSATLFAGVANAAPFYGIASQPISQAVENFSGNNFRVVILRANENDSAGYQYADYATNPELYQANIAALQNAISANKSLKSALLARNVQLNNVVAADQAANGGLTFYLR